MKDSCITIMQSVIDESQLLLIPNNKNYKTFDRVYYKHSIKHSIKHSSDYSSNIKGKMSYTWRDLQQLDFIGNKVKFERDPQVQESYDQFLKQRKNTTTNRLTPTELYNTFRCELPDSSQISNTDKYCFCRNTYPYNFESGILHYLLWINPKYYNNNTSRNVAFKQKMNNRSYVQDIVVSFLNKNFLDREYVIFQNAIENKSIPAIEHFHILIRVS